MSCLAAKLHNYSVFHHYCDVAVSIDTTMGASLPCQRLH
jgi:hypothetical protein